MSLNVLLADDDNIAVFLQKIIILDSGLTKELSTFSHGKEILEFLDIHAPAGEDYLIFLDINMPVMGGIEFLDTLQGRPYADNVWVALVSSYSAARDQETAARYRQVISIYEKPVTIETCHMILHLPQVQAILSKTS